MLKKVFKYLGLVLGLLTCLPLFVAPFALVGNNSVTNSSSSESYKLFADFDGLKNLYKLADKTFASFWVTLFQIAVIAALVVAVVMLVVYLFNDLGVVKAQKLEKLLAAVLVVVGIVALIAIALCSLTNVITTQIGSVKATTKFVGSVIGWLTPVFAIVGGALANYGSQGKSKKKKK